jgi:hypothetical protein
MVTIMAKKYEDESKWGKDEANKISKGGAQLKGEPTKGNLRAWASYASQNSFDPYGKAGKAQAKRDLSGAGASRDVGLGDAEGHAKRLGGEGQDTKGWKHWSEVSKRYSYTRKGGSKGGE